GSRDYRVIVNRGLLDRVGAEASRAAPGVVRWIVVADDTVAALYGDRVRRSFAAATDVLTFPAGEAHKTRATWADLTDRMVALGAGRDAGVVALGGGVTGDLAGFVAATYLRGIPVVQVPTSVVAMVDSAVGGKTGVDTAAGKNLVGAFHPPAVVLVDPTAVATLPRRQRAEGLAEAVKHGAIVDADYARALERDAEALLDGDVPAVERMVVRSVEVKADVVSRDEREGGLREILNFGHTLGHALEAASDYRMSHGEAVAVGMVLEARLGEAVGATRPGTADELAGILESVGLPTAPPAGLPRDRVEGFLTTDKKVRKGRPRFVLLAGLGAVDGSGGTWARPVDELPLARVLDTA
ncbi:MAG: 3-dehydroquinate synthase, partial [Longimicrobiales bacterium]